MVNDVTSIKSLLLNVDYDDAYVAYINGVEVWRENIVGNNPPYNQVAIGYVEPLISNGQKPETISIDNFENIIVNGENVLAIQVHNNSNISSDLTLIPFLSTISTIDEYPNPIPLLEIADSRFHTNFKISSSAETVYLSNPSNQIVDSIVIENMPPDISYGSNNSGAFVYYQLPTPGFQNSGIELDGIITESIIFSQLGGQSGSLSLTLSGVVPPNIIRYTTDASIPRINSPAYTTPIIISDNTVVRARIFRQDYFPSPIQTETYLINVDHDLPIISLVSETNNLFNEDTGIYSFGDTYEFNYPYFGANFWQDWEKPVHFTLMEEDGTQFSFDGGLKIFGGWSRANEQRSFSLFARSQYGTNEIDFPLFKDNEYNTYQAFILRNSGNDWLSTMMRDGMLTGLMRDSGLETQAFRPAATYINGEYWGMYNMREKTNEHFIASRHNIDPDDIDLLEIDAVTLHGSNQDYEELINFANSTNFGNDANYDLISDLVDIDNIIMYYLAQIYFNNTDWPGNNIKYWKEKNGKWRWILYDIDFGFGRWNYFDFQNNTLEFALQANGPNWPNPPWSTLLFRKLNENLGFRHQFINQYADEMNSRFLSEKVHAHIESIRDMISSEMSAHFSRWGESSNQWNNDVDNLKDFASQRLNFCREHILDVYNLPEYHQVQILNTLPSHGYVQLNSLRIEDSSWNGIYFENVPINITALPRPGYQFVKWEGSITSTNPTLTVNMIDAMQLRPMWEVDQNFEYGIVINEINYNSNPAQDTDDWVELYNASNNPIDLSGWTLKDADDTHEFSIPAQTVLASNDFLIIAKDEVAFTTLHPDVLNVVGNFNFGLSSTSDQIRIFDDQGELHDIVDYLSIAPWPSAPNGEGPTLELINPILDNSLPENWKDLNDYGSPGVENQEILSTDLIQPFYNIKISPNPASNHISISVNVFQSGLYTINIFDANGKLVIPINDGFLSDFKTYNYQPNISNLPSAIYFLSIKDSNGKVVSQKFQKI